MKQAADVISQHMAIDTGEKQHSSSADSFTDILSSASFLNYEVPEQWEATDPEN